MYYAVDLTYNKSAYFCLLYKKFVGLVSFTFATTAGPLQSGRRLDTHPELWLRAPYITWHCRWLPRQQTAKM